MNKLLRQVERALAFLDGGEELLLQDADGGVVWQLEVVYTRHDAGKVVVGDVGRLAGLADDGEHWRQALES